MTIPREMHIRDHRLYLTPIKEIEALKMGALYQGHGEEISLDPVAKLGRALNTGKDEPGDTRKHKNCK